MLHEPRVTLNNKLKSQFSKLESKNETESTPKKEPKNLLFYTQILPPKMPSCNKICLKLLQNFCYKKRDTPCSAKTYGCSQKKFCLKLLQTSRGCEVLHVPRVTRNNKQKSGVSRYSFVPLRSTFGCRSVADAPLRLTVDCSGSLKRR